MNAPLSDEALDKLSLLGISLITDVELRRLRAAEDRARRLARERNGLIEAIKFSRETLFDSWIELERREADLDRRTGDRYLVRGGYPWERGGGRHVQ